MLIHKKIREQVAQQLETLGIDGQVFAGRPPFIDLDNTPLTIAVIIDEAQASEESLCDSEWQAVLSVVIYQRSSVGEAPLDELAEKIANHLDHAFEQEQLNCLNEMYLMGYQYDQDAQKRTWLIASLQYQIHY
ncbi:phage tail protein [Pasteurellaceae bacterium 20609_3]|uniref:phage tail terminator protein n=1 Tax=Spirabiliibacterium mucosae TaxID=28156 RepID=UPI001AADDA77|nr:phage tail terminator protein [Spirabiliibacterium mucosae]MBE2898086.1 phage tail protein [Spirabiliibacterium mucosae]